jgi:hypothetical protein
MLPSSGIQRRVVCMGTDVSEERITSIFRVEEQAARKQRAAATRRCITEDSNMQYVVLSVIFFIRKPSWL